MTLLLSNGCFSRELDFDDQHTHDGPYLKFQGIQHLLLPSMTTIDIASILCILCRDMFPEDIYALKNE